ncbi:MAG: hypothetical protein J6S85_06180 [Methanobrevibacter sp.]|nr:hypothetical protein [Methanobrevibacter sp.]
MSKQPKYYVVEFKTIEGYKTEIFEDLEEAKMFYDMVANIQERNSIIAIYEVEKISIHNTNYYIELKTLKIK